MRKTAFLSLMFFTIVVAGTAIFFLEQKTTVQLSPSQFHTSMYYFDNSDFFSASLKPFASTTPATPRPRIFITNQHILAASLIAHQFALSRDSSVKRVILITQNNWDAGTAPIITSMDDWKTPLGNIPVNAFLTNDLVGKNLATVDEEVLVREHGITGIIPYVAYAFPNAEVTVLVIRDKTPDAVLDRLASELEKQTDGSTVVVGTIDMSHYLPKYLADVHDNKTEQAIEHFDYDALPTLDIDTAPTLRVVMKVAEQLGEGTFNVTAHTNSADITNQPDLLSTTSYITGYFSRGPSAVTIEPVHLLFTGDMMFDRYVALHAKTSGDAALFSQIERMFLGVDGVVANLEGTITDQPSVSISNLSLLRFTFDPHIAGFLKDLDITAVSLSNNHTFDFGESGYDSTKSFLTQAGVLSFGSPHNDDELSATLNIHGKTVCLVGYEGFVNAAPTPIAAKIASIRSSCDLVIATMHAGVEYFPGDTAQQQDVAHAFIGAGADLVVGTHPHVVEPLEIYKGKAIFYSLGNFIFDQNFSFATEHGLAVDMEWDGSEVRYTLVPVTIQGEEVSFPDTADREKTLSALVDNNLPKDVAQDILSTYSFTLK